MLTKAPNIMKQTITNITKSETKDALNFINKTYGINEKIMLSSGYIKNYILPNIIENLNNNETIIQQLQKGCKNNINWLESIHQSYQHDKKFSISLFAQTDDKLYYLERGKKYNLAKHLIGKIIEKDDNIKKLKYYNTIIEKNNQNFATIFLADILTIFEIMSIQCDKKTLEKITKIAMLTTNHDEELNKHDMKKENINYNQIIIIKRHCMIITLTTIMLISKYLNIHINKLMKQIFEIDLITAFDIYNEQNIIKQTFNETPTLDTKINNNIIKLITTHDIIQTSIVKNIKYNNKNNHIINKILKILFKIKNILNITLNYQCDNRKYKIDYSHLQ